jgi:hypothetical protein
MRKILIASVLLAATVRSDPTPSAFPQEGKDADLGARLRDTNRRLLAQLAKEIEKPERRPHDVRARAELLGRDPARIIDFARKNIRFEPYPGLARGPAGVLVSGAGNALDKAFLLRELLRACGVEARMVKGTLSREQAASLVKASVEALRARPEGRWTGPFGRGEVSKEGYEAACRELGISAEELLKLGFAEEKAEQASWTDVQELAARESQFLESQREARDPAPPALWDRWVEDARVHAWVEWKAKGENTWTAADPCLPGGTRGVAPEGELDPATVADRFTVTLSLERKTGEKRETAEVLKSSVAVHEVLVEPMRLTIQPTDFKLPKPGEPFTSEDYSRQLALSKEYIAVATVGERPPASMVFDYSGQVSKPQMIAGKIGGSSVAAVAKVAELFGGDDKTQKSTLERLWVDLSMSREGKVLWTQRRGVLEEGARETWCPVLTWDFFLPTCEISREFVRFVRISHQVRNQPVVDTLEEWARSKDRDLSKLGSARVSNYPVDLVAFAVARQAYVEAAGGGRRWLSYDRPNVFISGRQARLYGQPRDVCLCYGIDLVENGALVLDLGEEPKLDRAATQALGAFDTVLEQSKVAAANAPEIAVGALTFFERARMMGHPMRRLSAGDAAGLTAAGVSKSDVEWIGQRGLSVIVAAGMDRSHCGGTYAWWELDPGTGRALGRLSGGRGGSAARAVPRQEVAEYMEVLSTVNNAICAAKVMGKILAGNSTAAGNQATDCVVSMFYSEVFSLSGLGVLNWVRDCFEMNDNIRGK